MFEGRAKKTEGKKAKETTENAKEKSIDKMSPKRKGAAVKDKKTASSPKKTKGKKTSENPKHF